MYCPTPVHSPRQLPFSFKRSSFISKIQVCITCSSTGTRFELEGSELDSRYICESFEFDGKAFEFSELEAPEIDLENFKFEFEFSTVSELDSKAFVLDDAEDSEFDSEASRFGDKAAEDSEIDSEASKIDDAAAEDSEFDS